MTGCIGRKNLMNLLQIKIADSKTIMPRALELKNLERDISRGRETNIGFSRGVTSI